MRVGGTALFAVSAAGSPPLRYAWRRNGADIHGAVDSMLAVAPVAEDDDGAEFVVAVSNGAGTVTSAPARLAVVVPPRITQQPQDATVDLGQTATFSVAVVGSSPLAFMWRRDGQPIADASTATYSRAALAEDDSSAYSVVVSNAAGTTTSAPARLRVRAPPRILLQPAAHSVLSGIPASFHVVATGGNLQYEWRRNAVRIPGATRSTYTVGVPLAGDDGAAYSVVVTNTLGADVSTSVRLSVSGALGLRSTSYANAKGANMLPLALPVAGNARALAEFGGPGRNDYFVATLTYDPQKPLEQARPGEFQFWHHAAGSFVRDAQRLDSASGCVHPRKAAVADFNEDGRPDVFVACHGYDGPPFPGEQNRVLLSTPNGTYANRLVSSAPPGFYHSVTALDVNADGHIDVVVTQHLGSQALQVLLNNGRGVFTRRLDLSPSISGPYFTVEGADIDGDGLIDLLAGGHDWEGAESIVLINDGSGSFAAAKPHVLPRVAGEGVVLDFVVLDADRDGASEAYILRTSGGDGTFYGSRCVQRVTWPSLVSTVVVSQRPAQWIDYLVPYFDGQSYRLLSDNVLSPFSVPLP